MDPPLSRSRGGRRRAGLGGMLVVGGTIALAAVLVLGPPSRSTVGARPDSARIVAGEPRTFDPARMSDATTSAVNAQLHETVTSIDPSLTVRPALAASWEVLDGGRRILFTLRPGLRFSDGSPLTAADVVRSWLRLLDPDRPSPLASILADVEGADAYLRGESRDPGSVGFRVDGDRVEARLARPASDFLGVLASPTMAVVPPGIEDGGTTRPGSFVGSGGYTVEDARDGLLVLRANPHYWAGEPAIRTIELVTDLRGRSPVQVFEDGEVDYTSIFVSDAAWIAYDRVLGPQLREIPSNATDFYGFRTDQPPFDDPTVRRAFALAIDWDRLVRIASPDSAVATSMVPPSIPGRSERDFSPPHDPDAARALLAEAGFPGGSGFPAVTLVTSGYRYDAAIAHELERELGIEVAIEALEWEAYTDRLDTDPPAFWALSWVADYPAPNDFLGVLLGTGRVTNYARWSNAAFDAAIADAGSTGDPAAIRAAYDRAESILRDEVPIIPVSYQTGWALSQPGLLGAGPNGVGELRLAGLAWEDGP